MSRLKSYLRAATVFALLTITGALTNSRQAAAQDRVVPVEIVRPLPLPAAAAQSGPWNVGLTAGSRVLVGNTASDPVKVRAVDEVGQPVHDNEPAPFEEGVFVTTRDVYNVPAGKRLVVEYAGLFCALPAGQAAVTRFESFASGHFRFNFLTVTPIANGPSATTSYTSFGSPVRIYADPSTTLRATLSRTGTTGTGTCELAFSGRLVDIP